MIYIYNYIYISLKDLETARAISYMYMCLYDIFGEFEGSEAGTALSRRKSPALPSKIFRHFDLKNSLMFLIPCFQATTFRGLHASFTIATK